MHALTKVTVQTPQKQGVRPKENTTGKKKQELTNEELKNCKQKTGEALGTGETHGGQLYTT